MNFKEMYRKIVFNKNIFLLKRINKIVKNNLIMKNQISLGTHCMNQGKFYRFIFALMCLMGCSLQIYYISEIYFQYETTTLVKYKNVLKISLPAITICIEKKYLLRNQSLGYIFSLKDTFNRSQEDYKKILDFINNRTVIEQHNILYDSWDVFRNDCWVMRPNGLNTSADYVQCHEIEPIRRSIDYFSACFTIFGPKREDRTGVDRYLIDYDVSIQNYWLEIINLKINLNITSINLYLHSPKHKICDSLDYNMIKVSKVKDEKSCIKYHVHEIKLMPKPYSTRCVQYSDQGYRSRLDCVLKCKIRKLRQQYKKWPGNFLADQDQLLTNENETMIDMIKEMGDNTSMDLEVCQNALLS